MSNDYVLFTDRVNELKKQSRKTEGSRKSIKFTKDSFLAFKKSIDREINGLIEKRILKDQQRYEKKYDGLETRISDSKVEVDPVKVGTEINRLANLSIKLTYMCDVLEKRRSKIEDGKQPKKFKISSLSKTHIKQVFISKLYKSKEKLDVISSRIGKVHDIQQQYSTVGNTVLDAIETNDLEKAREELGRLETYRTEWFKSLVNQDASVGDKQNLNATNNSTSLGQQTSESKVDPIVGDKNLTMTNEPASVETQPIENQAEPVVKAENVESEKKTSSITEFMFGNVGIDPAKPIASEPLQTDVDPFAKAYDDFKNKTSQAGMTVDKTEENKASQAVSDSVSSVADEVDLNAVGFNAENEEIDPLDSIVSPAVDIDEEKSASGFVSDASQSPMTKEDAYSLGEKAAEEVDIESLIRPNVEKQSVDNQPVGPSWQSTLKPTSDYLHNLSESSKPAPVETPVAQEETGASEVDQKASQVFEALKAAGLTPEQMRGYIDAMTAESMGESVDAPKRSM